MKPIESELGSVISCSEAAILHVTFWNCCCSSIGVSIRYQISNNAVARSWSCHGHDFKQLMKNKCLNNFINKLSTVRILCNFTSRSLWIVRVSLSIVSLLTFFDSSGPSKLGWISLAVCLKSISSTEHKEFRVFKWSSTFLKRSFCVTMEEVWARSIKF